MVIWYVLLVLFSIYFFYLSYKAIWYLVKIVCLVINLKKLAKQGYHIEKKRSILSMFFGKKGLCDFVITVGDQKYQIHLVSFISTHGRWNIERGNTCYFIEARRYNRVFYNAYNNSSDEPEFSREFRRESSFQKSVFYLPRLDVSPEENRIVLIYPIPRLLTYTEKKIDYLKSGSVFHGYTVLYWQDFLNHLKQRGVDCNVK